MHSDKAMHALLRCARISLTYMQLFAARTMSKTAGANMNTRAKIMRKDCSKHAACTHLAAARSDVAHLCRSGGHTQCFSTQKNAGHRICTRLNYRTETILLLFENGVSVDHTPCHSEEKKQT